MCLDTQVEVPYNNIVLISKNYIRTCCGNNCIRTCYSKNYIRIGVVTTVSGLTVVTTVAETGSALDVMGGSIKELVAVDCTCASEVPCASPHNVGGHKVTKRNCFFKLSFRFIT